MNTPRLFIFAVLLAACSTDPETTTTGGVPQECNASPSTTGATVGDHFPDVQLTDCNGVRSTLDSYRCDNEITLLSIGAGWCMPCREETPHLEAAAANLGPQGVGVVQVLFQDSNALGATTTFCQAWVDEFALTIPVFIDPVGNTLAPFNDSNVATQMPLNLILDRDGKILFSETGLLADVEGTLLKHLP